jgi:SNF2 family DNA or RNA helicase
VLSELARECPPAAALLLPDAAFLDAGKVRFLGALLERLPLKPGSSGDGGGKGAADASSSGAGGGSRRRYASRVLVFSQFTQVLDILAQCLRLMGHGHGCWARIDGSTPAGERQAIIDRWTADDVSGRGTVIACCCGGAG